MNRRPLRFRRAPHLISYWEDGQLIFENYATGGRITAEPLVAEILHFFGDWRSVEALGRHLTDWSVASLHTAVAALERHSLLVRAGRPSDPRIAAMEGWTSWNPAAGFFHASTKDLKYLADQRAVDRLLRRKATRVPVPSPVKQYSDAAHIDLPPVDSSAAFPAVLRARRTWRDFSRRPISLVELSTLLRLTWGIHDWLDLAGIGRFALKTSPSGGARHPIEVYVLVLRVAGLQRGLYHYAADRHRLDLLRSGASARQIIAYVPSQSWFSGAAALMLMTAVFERTQWKYEFARAYRVVLAESGHLCQTFCLTATWLGLAPFCTMALADSRI